MTRSLTKTILKAGLSTLLGGLTLSAQSRTLVADIPFAFQAEGKVMPAGSYSLTESATAQNIFHIANRDAKVSQFLNAPVPKHYMPKESKLLFAQYGNQYVLTEISIAGTTNTQAVSPSAIRKNSNRKLGFASMISVPLHTR